RFLLALAKEQEGKREEAAAGWLALLAETPADAPWRAPLEEALARVDTVAPGGPDADQVAAAETMSPDERSAMIAGMVDGLAARLKGAPDDVEGWLSLIRSYAVLNRRDEAVEAADAALKGVSREGDRARVTALIADLGLDPAGTGAP
ncbi:MAG: c-type cytochrome biogenesis protein CcmI, partial [Pseudomonadota bacterium]|nr:c-type cytochrome biogenesis protein CcmI [Pseudomonadota bacterium]